MGALPDLLDDARALLADADQKLARLRAIEPYLIDISLRENPVGSSIAWLHANITGDHGGAPRILINIVDGCDALTNNLECSRALLADEPIEGVSIEGDRGTCLPSQVGAWPKSRAIAPTRSRTRCWTG